jgi:hypothetical protein
MSSVNGFRRAAKQKKALVRTVGAALLATAAIGMTVNQPASAAPARTSYNLVFIGKDIPKRVHSVELWRTDSHGHYQVKGPCAGRLEHGVDYNTHWRVPANAGVAVGSYRSANCKTGDLASHTVGIAPGKGHHPVNWRASLKDVDN